MSQSSPLAAARRNSELGLVVMAAGISAVAFVLASLGKNSTMPATLVPFLIALLGMLIAAHIATRLLALGADGTLLPLAQPAPRTGSLILGVRPENVAPHVDGSWLMKVEMVEMLGAERLVHGRLGADLFTLRIASTEPVPGVGKVLPLRVDPSHLHWFDAGSRQRV